MIVKLLTEHDFEFGVSKLKRRLPRPVWVYMCQMTHCWKSHALAIMIIFAYSGPS